MLRTFKVVIAAKIAIKPEPGNLQNFSIPILPVIASVAITKPIPQNNVANPQITLPATINVKYAIAISEVGKQVNWTTVISPVVVLVAITALPQARKNPILTLVLLPCVKHAIALH
jgi:hypothetical protein